ncbi:Unknown protein sequence [Pseudomonas amygdali pv. dendropanacis]|uniref:Uncharacterized protein n=1 Tax=Pseudomonas amygdali pv. dendropanacis TaxID=235272 RepID=A0A0P9QY20_PSEA0|nr:Unknown protein sequence [Pseudomonas amygdali pv. dendropanacis]
MRTHRKRDGQYRHPQAAGVGGEYHAADSDGKDQHRQQTRSGRTHAAPDQPGGQNAATHAAEVSGQPDQDQRDAHLRHADTQVVLLIEKRRQPVQVEPEHRRSNRVSQRERPRAAHLQNAGEGHLDRRRFDFLINIIQLGLADGRMLFGVVVLQAPHDDPDQPQRTHRYKGRLPAPDGKDQRQQRRRQHCADVGASVENASRHGTFTCREPQTCGLYTGRVVGSLGQAENEPADHEAHSGSRKAMSAGRQAPQQHREEERALDADLVDKAALQHEAHRVTDLKPEVDVSVVHRRPAHFLGEDGLHDAKRRPVDVVQRGGEEHQGEHAPARLAHGECAANLFAHPGTGGLGDRVGLGVKHDVLTIRSRTVLLATVGLRSPLDAGVVQVK